MASSPARAGAPTIGVATVSYGSEAELAAFLGTLGSASSVPLRVVVSDNLAGTPENGVREICERYGAHYLAMPSNLGYGAAMNEAVRSMEATVEWVLVSNPDVRLTPG